MQTEETLKDIASRCFFELIPGQKWIFKIGQDESRFYLQIKCDGTCNVTGEPMDWSGRKWFVSQHMTDSEIVQTAFKAVLTALEHEAREHFKYAPAAYKINNEEPLPIFDPHYDVDRLYALRKANALSERTGTIK